MEYLKKVYGGKKVFVTGHTGFKGSWFLCMLQLLGAEVKGYALDPEAALSLYNQIQGDDTCTSIIADILNKTTLQDEILAFQPDFIFHLAAQPLVRKSYQMPVETITVNSIGTLHVLEAARCMNKHCSVIIITTDKVYENRETMHAYNEQDRLGGYDPYSASKACAEIIVNAYRQSFFKTGNNNYKKGIASARAGNVIGGGDWSVDRIVPDLVRALEKGETVVMRNPKAVRPWQHVLEPLTGYLKLGAMLQEDPQLYGEAFNFGPFEADTLQVDELVAIGIKAWGSGLAATQTETKSVHEATLLRLDITKAKQCLNWVPVLSATQAIEWTIEWYKQYNKVSPRDLLQQQIQKYWSLSA